MWRRAQTKAKEQPGHGDRGETCGAPMLRRIHAGRLRTAPAAAGITPFPSNPLPAQSGAIVISPGPRDRRREQDDRHRQSRRLPRPQSRQACAPRRPRSADQRLPFPHTRESLVRVGGGTGRDGGHLRSRRRKKTRQARQSPQVQGVHRPQRCPPISLASISSQATSPSPSSTSTWRRGRDANASSAAAWTKSGTTTT